MFWYNSAFCKSIDVFSVFENTVYDCAHWLTTKVYSDVCSWVGTNISIFVPPVSVQSSPTLLIVKEFLDTVTKSTVGVVYRTTPSCWIWSDLAHGSIVLGLFCLALCALLWYVDSLALRYWKRYAKLPSRNRQLYVLLNLSKAFCLALLFFSHVWFSELYALFVLDQWSTVGWRRLARIKHTAALYVATDIVALFVVPRLPKTTVVHHYVAWVLALCIFGTDVSRPESQVIRMVMLYGAWSTVPYAVNAFLALRRLSDDPDDGQQKPKTSAVPTTNIVVEKAKACGCCETTATTQKDTQAPVDGTVNKDVRFIGRRRLNALAAFSLLVYSVTCTFNWAWHAYWIVGEIKRALFEFIDMHDASFKKYFVDSATDTWWSPLITVLYSLSVALLARDDLILMKWLWTRAQEIPVVDFCVQLIFLVRTAVWKSLQFFSYRSLPERTTEVKE